MHVYQGLVQQQKNELNVKLSSMKVVVQVPGVPGLALHHGMTVMKCRLQDALFILYPGILTFDSKENINFDIRCAMRFQV